jgi:hypothetical protein
MCGSVSRKATFLLCSSAPRSSSQTLEQGIRASKIPGAMYKDWNDPDQVQAKEQILGGELMPVSLVL